MLDITLIISVTIAVLGWFVVNRLESILETKKKRLEFRSENLVTIYSDLTELMAYSNSSKIRASEDSREQVDLIIDIIRYIQLFGDANQIKLALKMGDDYAKAMKYPGSIVDVEPLVNSVRDSLRKYLNLEDVNCPVNILSLNKNIEQAGGD